MFRKALTIVILSLLVIAPTSFAEVTHVHNVKGYTMSSDGKLVTFTNMIVEDGKVANIGGEALGHAFPTAQQFDGNGNTLLPGLIDAHGHLLGLGASLLEVDVRAATSAEDAAKKVAEYYRSHDELSWVTGGGWNQVLWPDKQFPSAATLDEGVKDVPVWLERVDGHAGWANSKALQLAGITRDSVAPEGGKILKDSNGEPTGVLIDTAMFLVSELIPTQDEAILNQRLNEAGAHLLSLGVTSMHDAGIDKQTYDFYQALAANEQLPVRVYGMLSAIDPSLPDMLKAGHIKTQDDMLLIRSVKAYGDGALGSRGAALLQPYSDDPHNHGLLVTPQEQLPDLFKRVISNNFALHFHAIGDRANQLALDHFESTFEQVGGQDLRHRIEHAQVIDVNDIPRFKSLNIIPSMQPTHATSDKNMAEDRVGKERLKGAYAWRTFLEQGSPLAFGSDFPVELANPFYGLHAAVTRQDRDNQPVAGWVPEQALTIQEAFRAFTIDAAYAADQDKQLGSLEAGKWADFILIDQDIFAIDAKDIWKTNVIKTFIAGQEVYSESQ